MKKYSKINENDVRRLIKQILTEGKQILTEGISNDVVDKIFNAHPGKLDGSELFPLIIPKQYKATEQVQFRHNTSK